MSVKRLVDEASYRPDACELEWDILRGTYEIIDATVCCDWERHVHRKIRESDENCGWKDGPLDTDWEVMDERASFKWRRIRLPGHPFEEQLQDYARQCHKKTDIMKETWIRDIVSDRTQEDGRLQDLFGGVVLPAEEVQSFLAEEDKHSKVLEEPSSSGLPSSKPIRVPDFSLPIPAAQALGRWWRLDAAEERYLWSTACGEFHGADIDADRLLGVSLREWSVVPESYTRVVCSYSSFCLLHRKGYRKLFNGTWAPEAQLREALELLASDTAPAPRLCLKRREGRPFDWFSMESDVADSPSRLSNDSDGVGSLGVPCGAVEDDNAILYTRDMLDFAFAVWRRTAAIDGALHVDGECDTLHADNTHIADDLAQSVWPWQAIGVPAVAMGYVPAPMYMQQVHPSQMQLVQSGHFCTAHQMVTVMLVPAAQPVYLPIMLGTMSASAQSPNQMSANPAPWYPSQAFGDGQYQHEHSQTFSMHLGGGGLGQRGEQQQAHQQQQMQNQPQQQ